MSTKFLFFLSRYETLNLYISILCCTFMAHFIHRSNRRHVHRVYPEIGPGRKLVTACRMPAAFFMKFRRLIERIRDAPTTVYERIREILRFK